MAATKLEVFCLLILIISIRTTQCQHRLFSQHKKRDISFMFYFELITIFFITTVPCFISFLNCCFFFTRRLLLLTRSNVLHLKYFLPLVSVLRFIRKTYTKPYSCQYPLVFASVVTTSRLSPLGLPTTFTSKFQYQYL